jgi:hypothetical protein
MPNGKPGDHPLTDILMHQVEVYGLEVDGLIRQIAALCSRRELDRWWEEEIGWKSNREGLKERAEARLAFLERRARASGWETNS